MPEIKIKLIPYQTHYVCDDCIEKPNPGCILIKIGEAFMTYPPFYVYVCPNCKKKYEFQKIYPSIEYEEVNEY